MCANVNFRCPRCGYDGLRRARQRWYDAIGIWLTGFRPYECASCQTTRRWWRAAMVSPELR